MASQILRLSHGKKTRVDFLRDLCHLLIRHTNSDAMELWFEENGACARCRIGPDQPEPFEFQLSPCHHRDSSKSVRPENPLCGPIREATSNDDAASKGICWRGGKGTRTRSDSRPFSYDSDNCQSLQLPLTMGGETVGWMLLHYLESDDARAADLTALEALAQSCSIALVSQRAQAALRERVKELTGLYRMAQLSNNPGVSLDQLLQGVAELLPPSWQYPAIAVGKIELDGRCFATAPDQSTQCRQRAPLIVGGENRGFVEVSYLEDRPTLDEGPFLVEERSLLDTIARELSGVIERLQAASEKKRLRHQLLHADRLATIGQLAAGVAHELNEPLGAVLGFAQLARKQHGLPETTDGDLEKIETAALHAREVVRKLLLFAHQTPPKTSQVYLKEVVETSLALLEAQCAKKNISVIRSLADDLPAITADVSQIQQVVINLTVNAIHAMPDGGNLTVTTEASDGSALLRVSDTGTGMAEELRDRVFLPFVTTKETGQGTGLGLSVVHGIVTAHGGTISVDSHLGEGSTFTVLLPAEPTQQGGVTDA